MRYRSWMWTEAVELLTRAERLHRQFFRRTGSSVGPTWEPPIDLFEEPEGRVTLLVALPGVPPEQLQVDIEGGLLRVAGNRPWPCGLRAATLRRLEIPHGRFERRIQLPAGIFTLEQREFAHGCLTIRLRRL
jgi:HSP20 family protein